MGYPRGGNVYHSFIRRSREDGGDYYFDLDLRPTTCAALMAAGEATGRNTNKRVGYCHTRLGEGSSSYVVAWEGWTDPEVPSYGRKPEEGGLPTLYFAELEGNSPEGRRMLEQIRKA